MELMVPGSDITGFEHETRTDSQEKQLATATEKLKDPLGLFVFSAEAGCHLISAKLETVEQDIHDEKDKHHHDEGQQGKNADEEETHNEFRLFYEISCQSPSRLTSIQFKYFDEFERAQELDVSVVTESSQTKFEVTRDSPIIGLGGVM